MRRLAVLALGALAVAALATSALSQDKPRKYKEQGLIQGTVDVSEVFTNALVEDINRFDQQAVTRQAREYR